MLPPVVKGDQTHFLQGVLPLIVEETHGQKLVTGCAVIKAKAGEEKGDAVAAVFSEKFACVPAHPFAIAAENAIEPGLGEELSSRSFFGEVERAIKGRSGCEVVGSDRITRQVRWFFCFAGNVMIRSREGVPPCCGSSHFLQTRRTTAPDE